MAAFFGDGLLRNLGIPVGDTVIRLGVTGLSRAGKTVFITSLVSNLLDRGRMPQLVAAANGDIRTAYLQPQPDDTVPRFAYEDHYHALTSAEPYWPEGTRRTSQLRLSLRMNPRGMLGSVTGERVVHLDIIDYPGEWLLDLGLLEKTYSAWSTQALGRARGRAEAEGFLAALSLIDPAQPFDEGVLRDLSQRFATYLQAARAAGYSDCTPGRFLLPGDLEGSPVLTFAPLPAGDYPRGSLGAEARRRYDAYVAQVVKPFFRDHFAKIDRQIVLVDVLGAIHAGPRAVEDLRVAMADILGAFRPGRNAFLASLFGARRVEKILFAATKADHLHHRQHARLTAITKSLLREARDRAAFSGAATAAMSIAALRTTVEEDVMHEGSILGVVRGKLLDGGRQAAFYPGDLPDEPQRLLSRAREGAEKWLDADYGIMNFAPAALSLRAGDGLPHIRLDKAAQFLIGDRL
ncbi:Conserved protein with nucleoside triphosphate hydrolase domain protein [Ketogulonicigenium robustum]|uniref:Conserved protein with nucleoside triphosphate hydrolase domain protein n=1 Tax=Ketogulonicigenium robustum TaxID=92947 RepID=A0A1W6P095_9RHOB|nr:YcjX family protein [Ketogulonicigenium robustum]ARO14833.1 Conserved protein with nucleoside triphosphate hydrolase domain protein [Ketogulonicigenium robustum]